MSDWHVGDLAVCVDKIPFDDGLEVGKTYTVCGVGGGGSGLSLVELPTDKGVWWFSRLFRKIRPDKHEACESEFITLLKRKKVSA